MRISKWINKRTNIVYTILADVLLQLLVLMLSLSLWLNQSWSVSQTVALKVPEMEGTIIDLPRKS